MTAVAPAVAPARTLVARPTRPMLVVLAMAALVAAYGLLSLLNDPRGTLGTDTGGKLATLETMDAHHTLEPDLGYWAEDLDPDGALHPIYYTRHIGDRWVNLTTVPMVLAADPLYATGGPRAVLLLPMLGAAFAALAARALAMRVSGGRGWWAFWTVGLASPIAVYALDFWEHAPGVALVLWGVVFVHDLVDGRAGWRGAAAAGLCFGAAATMRTDALVYAAVTVLVGGSTILTRELRGGTPAWRRMFGWGTAWIAGFVSMLAADVAVEELVAGGSIRAGRTADTAGNAGAGFLDRGKEAFTTGIGLNRFDERTDWILGALMVALVAYAAWRLLGPHRRERLIGAVALGGAVVLYVLRFADGFGFVPGVLSASPLAVAGLVVGWSARRWRISGTIAVIALPVVWFFQYSGGANPQWGGRYILTSGTLLVVGAAVVLAATPGAARVAFVVLAVLVTAGGIAWLSQRSHAVAAAMPRLAVPHDTVLVSTEAHLLREGGAFYRSDQRWLTAVDDRELARAAEIADAVDARELAVVSVAGRRVPDRLGDYRRTRAKRVEFLPGLDVTQVFYNRGGTGS